MRVRSTEGCINDATISWGAWTGGSGNELGGPAPRYLYSVQKQTSTPCSGPQSSTRLHQVHIRVAMQGMGTGCYRVESSLGLAAETMARQGISAADWGALKHFAAPVRRRIV